MAENEDSNSKNGTLDFKKRRGIYVPVEPTTSPLIKVLSSFWRWIGVGDKTLWNWLELLIVPLFLAGGAFYLENQTEARQEQIATNRYQQEALAKYLDQMTTLLLDENLRKSELGSEARSMARARTITALQELDVNRKGALVRFLYESDLISPSQPMSLLLNADLRGAILTGAELRSTILRGADLSDADLTDTDLIDADLRGANLTGANLSGALLQRADLDGAILDGANLTGANLDGANLTGAYLCKTTVPDGKVENRDCQRLREMLAS